MNYLTSFSLFESKSNQTIVYHGSNEKFKKFDLNKLSKKIGQYTYGLGIYTTDNKNLSDIYGKYTYVIDISDKNIIYFGEHDKHNKISQDTKNKLKGKTDLNLDGITVWELYSGLAKIEYDNMTMKEQFNWGRFNSYKKTSEFLLSNGIDGIKYPLSRELVYGEDGNPIKYNGYGYVLFGDDLKILEIIENK